MLDCQIKFYLNKFLQMGVKGVVDPLGVPRLERAEDLQRRHHAQLLQRLAALRIRNVRVAEVEIQPQVPLLGHQEHALENPVNTFNVVSSTWYI